MNEPWLIAGLRIHGERYARTRHNAGAMVVERICERLGAHLRKVRLLPVLAAEARHQDVPLVLTVPLTFMNVSGPPIASLARKREISPERIVACHDEIDLAFGALRIKRGGSTAGHHGLDSLVQGLRSADFYRVRIGVGRPPSRDRGVDHVLDTFPKRQQEDLAVLVEEAADAVLVLVREGLPTAQERFNRNSLG